MIFVSEPQFSGNEKKYLMECIDTGWVSSDGPFIKRLEAEFSSHLGRKFGVAVCNGTAALEVALYALGIKDGDEVILPSFTIISCVLAILRLNARPVLVDIDPDTWAMDVALIEKKITSRTKAILAVHIYGHPVDMDPILALAEKYGLKVLEDAAEAQGAEYKGRKCGTMGDAAAFSFYPNKLMTTGEGGIVVTDDETVYERAKSYRNLCFGDVERFSHLDLGYNFRMSNLQAAVGVAQLEKIHEVIEFKRTMGQYYVSQFSKIKGLKYQIEKEWAKSVYWMYCVQLDESLKITAMEMMARLQKKGIGTRPFFKGMHQQPALLNRGFFKGEAYPVTEKAYQYGFYLPSGMTLTKAQVDQVCLALKEIIS